MTTDTSLQGRCMMKTAWLGCALLVLADVANAAPSV
jgi:hypothetical protein